MLYDDLAEEALRGPVGSHHLLSPDEFDSSGRDPAQGIVWIKGHVPVHAKQPRATTCETVVTYGSSKSLSSKENLMDKTIAWSNVVATWLPLCAAELLSTRSPSSSRSVPLPSFVGCDGPKANASTVSIGPTDPRRHTTPAAPTPTWKPWPSRCGNT